MNTKLGPVSIIDISKHNNDLDVSNMGANSSEVRFSSDYFGDHVDASLTGDFSNKKGNYFDTGYLNFTGRTRTMSLDVTGSQGDDAFKIGHIKAVKYGTTSDFLDIPNNFIGTYYGLEGSDVFLVMKNQPNKLPEGTHDFKAGEGYDALRFNVNSTDMHITKTDEYHIKIDNGEKETSKLYSEFLIDDQMDRIMFADNNYSYEELRDIAEENPDRSDPDL